MSKFSNNRDAMAQEAQKRRELEGNTQFNLLGEPIQKLLLRVTGDISKEKMEKLTKVSVRLLAKVFDMLSVEEDPDKILAWLDAELEKNDPEAAKRNAEKKRKQKVDTGAAGDPIGLFREIEKKNMEMMEHFRKAQDDRESKRKANIANRRKAQEEARAKAAEERARAEAAGVKIDARDSMSKQDLRSIMGAFDRATKNSAVDNSEKQGDTEWWKGDEFRKDFEKHGKKGSLWNRVVEGGSAAAPEAEIAQREAWYKQAAWWKKEKCKKNWEATKDAEWWKEECYIRDWQDNGNKGAMWTAIDELAGFNRKGDRRPASSVELAQRVEWYKNNGPKGIVKDWCALIEGSKDRCTLEEKREREVYYRSGDWWKSDKCQRALKENPTSCEALKFAGAAGEDREWWKDERFRKDFEKGGDLWRSANEKSAVMTGGDVPCTEAEMKKRKEWFTDHWWKADEYIQDFQKNGEKGSKWRARTKADTVGGPSAKMCRDSEAKERAEWYKSAEDREWWKDEAMLRDFTENGEKGKKWKAAFKDAALAGSGEEAAADEVAKRKKWMEDNWWKSDRYIKDFQTQGSKGSAWKVAKRNADQDTDWWKQGDFMKKFNAAKKADATPFWQSPEAIADYNANGSSGKKWCATHAAAASVNRGQEEKAPADELAAREAWLKENFWRAPDCVADYAANGTHGKKWTKKNKDSNEACDAAELKKRQETFQPKDAVPAAYDAMFEADAYQKIGGDVASPEEILKRQERLRKEWWKGPTAREDYKKNGEKGHIWKANCPEAAALGISADPANQASPAELAERKKWLAAEKPDDEFWTSDACRKEFATKNREPEFWKNPEIIADYQQNGSAGKKWKAKNAAAAAAGRDEPVTDAEAADREDWLKKNFWKAPKYQEDFLKNGEKGTLWTTTQPDGKGTTASDDELKARAAHFKPNQRWQLKDKPSDEALASNKLATCSAAEALDREEWFKKNWWKAPEVKADWEKHGKAGKLFKAKTPEAAEMGLSDQPEYQASPEELAAREEYFELSADEQDWWKDPNMIDDFIKNGKNGARWTARNAKDAAQNLGVEQPATGDELEKRAAWMKKNFWKAPESIEDYKKEGDSGKKWKAKGQDDASPLEPSSEELRKRRTWMEKHAPADSDELQKRKDWFERQLTDEEKIHRRKWIAKQNDEAKRIHVDELADVLAQLNDGQEPTPEQLEAIAAYVKKKKAQEGSGDDQTISQEEFVSAVADTNFYVPVTDEERARAEQEALEAMELEEMNRMEEEAAFLALEAEEELKKAGTTYEEMQENKAAEEEEAAFLAEQEAAEAEAEYNPDNGEAEEWDEEAWAKYYEEQAAAEAAEGGEYTEEEAARLAAEEEERQAAEQAAAEEAWASEELGEEDGTGDAEATIDEDQKEELEEIIEEEPAEEEYEEGEMSEEQQQQAEIDEMSREEKGAPLQWKLPLPQVTNPHYLKSYFTVLKFTPNTGLLSGAQKRVWVVDHFTRTFYNLDNSGKIKKEHAANKLLQLERNIMDPNRCRLMFFDSSHSYELQFFSPLERERFFETAQAIRPSIRVYAPDLTNQDVNVEACTTTIDGVGPNTVSCVAPNATGKPVKRELTGECKINASKLLTEPVTIWTGTFNLAGKPPPRNQAELNTWLPKDKYDIYAVACQEASYRKEEGEWFEYVQRHLGRDYLSLASMNLWDSLLIVLAKKKHLLKITCVEGSTKATQHKQVCGTKGGIGISLRYLETSFAFITCQLAARVERTQMRNTNVEEIVDGLQLGIHETDFTSQFNHVFFFGDFNYRIELDAAVAMQKIEAADYPNLLIADQLTLQKTEHGMFAGFEEPPITFPPTYRMMQGPQNVGKYQAEKGNAPSYCDRVLTRSMSNTWIKCTSYTSSPKITTSEHQPVAATFITRCVRPTLSCFMKQQTPIPLFNFMEVNVVQSPGVVIKKPQLLVLSPFTARINALDAKAGNTQNPQFDGRQALKLLSVTQCQEYLETCHFIFVIRDSVEKRADKAHRGTAVMPLFGKCLGMEGVPQDIDCEILCHGKLCGRLTGKWMWTPGDPAAMQAPAKK